MAYMNFNTDTKFWSRLTVQSFATIPTVTDKGCIAFYDTSNNGMMSVAGATEGTYEWKPIVHTVEASTGSSDSGEVTQNGGHVIITFPKSGGGSGNCTKKTLVSNVNGSASNPISSVIVVLPQSFDNEKSFLMTTVYSINDKGVIEGTIQPDVTVMKTETDDYGVRFNFTTSVKSKIKIMILFDQTADDYNPDVYTNGNSVWSISEAESNIPTRDPGDKNKGLGA